MSVKAEAVPPAVAESENPAETVESGVSESAGRLAGSGRIAYFAITLWVAVGGLLSYGIFETVSKATAFF